MRIGRLLNQVDACLNYVDSQLGKTKYLTGDQMTIADFYLFLQLTDLVYLQRSFADKGNLNGFYQNLLGSRGVYSIHGPKTLWSNQLLPVMKEMFKISGAILETNKIEDAVRERDQLKSNLDFSLKEIQRLKNLIEMMEGKNTPAEKSQKALITRQRNKIMSLKKQIANVEGSKSMMKRFL